jgi:uncharacterized membrane protein
MNSGTLFEAVIVPHRSLSPRGMRILVCALCGAMSLSAIVLWLVGTWPVMGFSGGEILLAILLLRSNALGSRASEVLMLSEAGFRIIRTDQKGRRTEKVLSPSWLRVVLEEEPGRVPTLVLAAHGVREEIAASLGEAEKRNLAQSLSDAFHRWRNPTFDNPQLRE